MAISQRQIVQECFDEDRERDCSYCPAHHSKGGECCFGHRYEDHDPQCQECVHESACGPATLAFEQRSVQPRRPIRRTPTSNSRLPVYGQSKSNGNLLSSEDTAITQTSRKEEIIETLHGESQKKGGRTKRFFKGMGLHGLWGAGEGSLEMVLGYMRRRRPE